MGSHWAVTPCHHPTPSSRAEGPLSVGVPPPSAKAAHGRRAAGLLPPTPVSFPIPLHTILPPPPPPRKLTPPPPHRLSSPPAPRLLCCPPPSHRGVASVRVGSACFHLRCVLPGLSLNGLPRRCPLLKPEVPRPWDRPAKPAAREHCQPRHVGQAAGALSQPGAGSRVPLCISGGPLVTEWMGRQHCEDRTVHFVFKTAFLVEKQHVLNTENLRHAMKWKGKILNCPLCRSLASVPF